MALSFKPVADAALALAPVLLAQWLGGKRVGHEWQGEKKANGGPGDSWAINLNTGQWLHGSESGVQGGDLVSLYAALNHIDQLTALSQVAPMVGISDSGHKFKPPVLPRTAPAIEAPDLIPEDAPALLDHYKHGAAAVVYRYGDKFHIARYDTPDGKVFAQFTWRDGWKAKAYPEPRPLYRLSELAKHPDAPVLIVEGEKCAEIASAVLRAYVSVSWAGGAGAVAKNDWSALAGRNVIIWPDADEPGLKAAAKLAELLHSIAARVRVIVPGPDLTPGFDIGDAVALGWDSKAITKWCSERVTSPAREPEPSTAVAIIEKPKAVRKPRAAAVEAPDESAGVSWDTMRLDSNQGGIPHATVANASLIIQAHPKFAGKVWYDSFRDQVRHTLYGTEKRWTDSDDLNVCVFMQQTLRLPKFNTRLVIDGVMHAASVNQRNSLTEWLDSLEWDGTPRLDTWLADCLGVELTEYSAAVSKNWPIAMVARAYVPGCQVDNMPVLEGTQGRGKSRFLEILGGEWYKSINSAFGDKDFLQALKGAWLIEIPDMAGFGRREHTQILSTITVRTDEYRKSYGRHSESHPRVAMFAATSEQDDYIKDLRGRRRFWPLRCIDIDLDALHAQREQVFAEAVHQYRAGASWHNMPGVTADIEQIERSAPDLWTDKVLDFCDHTLLGAPGVPIQSNRILFTALEIPLSKQTDVEKHRIAKIMREAGWIPSRKTDYRGWIKPIRKA